MFYLSNGALIGLIIGGVVLFLIICIIIWAISTSNKLLTYNEKCEEALSGIDVQLTKRYDTLTKMLDITKGYMAHEKETLIEIIKMRNPNICKTIDERNQVASEMSEAYKQLTLAVERYPELKADTQFSKLNSAVVSIEEDIQASRRIYNSNVKALNTAIIVFPSSIIAKSKGFEKRAYFEAEEVKRNDVKMTF